VVNDVKTKILSMIQSFMLLLGSIVSILGLAGLEIPSLISFKMLASTLAAIAPIATFSLAIMTFITLRKFAIQAKYDRLVKEMENLVAPLFANIKRNSGEEFIQVYSDSVFVCDKALWKINEKGTAFLDNILRNKHLGAPYLRNALNSYFNNDPDCAGHSPNAEFKAVEKILIDATKRRYFELAGELEILEKRLGSR
jgi:hypothetical protein